MKTRCFATCVVAVLLLTAASAQAGDWPQFRGPNQDGISTEKCSVWPAEGPKLVWKVQDFSGWSSFAVSGDKVFTMIGRAGNEVCLALDAATGKELWAAELKRGAKFPENPGASTGKWEQGGYGPGSTPTISEGKVYVYSIDMNLCCLDAQTGKELWRVDVLKSHEGVLSWYECNNTSPVVEGDEVIVAGGGPGQFVLAFHKNTGKLVWKTETAISQHATPLVTTIHGIRQIIFYTKDDVMGISLKDHKTLWRSAVANHNGHSAMTPVVSEDKVYVGSFTEGSALYQVIPDEGGFYSKRVWFIGSEHTPLFSTPVLLDGCLYGQVSSYKPAFECIELATGKVKWRHGDKGCGMDILVGDKLVYLTERGALSLLDPKGEYKELAHLDKAIAGKTYSTPAFSNGRLYIRSSKEGACYDLSAK